MRKQIILSLRVAWTVAALVMLLMEATVCASSDQACRPAGDTMLAFMSVATFPAGIVCLIISAIACGLMGSDLSSSNFAAGLVMACGGCLQWYIVAPLLLQEPKLTLLNLNCVPPSPAKNETKVAAKESSTIEALQPATTIVARAPGKPRQPKRHNRVLPFDKLGRTPLERVINRHARDASA
jgi:hypothetical protein